MEDVVDLMENNKNLAFLVIDSEGIGNPYSNSNSDAKIFLLSLLLSSVFLYNTM